MSDWINKFRTEKDTHTYSSSDEHGHIVLNSERALRLELVRKDNSSSIIPYIHLGLIEYDGKGILMFQAMSLIVTIKGENLHHLTKGLRLEKIDIIYESITHTSFASDALKIDSLVVNDLKRTVR